MADHLTAVFVTHFPTTLEAGKFYISVEYASAAHLCRCGCQSEVVTPLSPTQWRVTFDGEISVMPSIGNWALACRSHYIIRRGEIIWAGPATTREVELNRRSDYRARDDAIARQEGRSDGLRSLFYRVFQRRE